MICLHSLTKFEINRKDMMTLVVGIEHLPMMVITDRFDDRQPQSISALILFALIKTPEHILG